LKGGPADQRIASLSFLHSARKQGEGIKTDKATGRRKKKRGRRGAKKSREKKKEVDPLPSKIRGKTKNPINDEARNKREEGGDS